MAQFQKGDIVNTSLALHAAGGSPKIGGVVKYVACHAATTGGGKTCDKKTCAHPAKDYVFVIWPPDKTIFSYHNTFLELSGAKPQAADNKEFAEKAKEVVAIIEKANEDGKLNSNKDEIDWVKYNSRLPGDIRTRAPRSA